MRRFPAILSLFIFTTPFVAGQGQPAALPFEGVIEFKMQNIESVQFFEMYVKGDRVRTQTKEKIDLFPIQIQDFGARTTYLLVTATERYVQASMTGGESEPETRLADVEGTEEKETIAGMPCEQFIVKMPGGELEVWVTLALGNVSGFSSSLNQGAATKPTWESYFNAKGYTAMRAIAYNADGHEQGRYEITNVTRKAVPESLFRVPRGYEKVAEEKDLVPRRR